MTLREKLDLKIKKESRKALYKEIEEIFLQASLEELLNGMTIELFSNDSNELFYKKSSEEKVIKTFRREYKLKTVEEVVQNLKKELSSLEKENEQLKVNIENSVNLNNIEQAAKEKLGMQKLTNKQAVYVSLPKKDYIETSTEEVKIEEDQNWFEKILNIFKK